ncbi:MAG: argininosuccinate lyase [Clostridiales bacterium]|jgi:argininosuccinate lyase|nr:argininosuccinate lyase [Clostridiales bacterium]
MENAQNDFRSQYKAEADAFMSAIETDKRLVKQDVMGSLAHCAMLGEYGVIDQAEAESLKAALSQIFFEISEDKLKVEGAPNLFAFFDAELEKRLGAVSQKLNLGRSFADRMALDLRMYVRESVEEVNSLLKALVLQLCEISGVGCRMLMPAYTHGRKAAPTTLAHTLMSYAEKFMRDIERLIDAEKRANFMPLGAMTGTGTLLPISRKRVAEILKFPAVTQNGQDAVSDRDFVVEYIAACALILSHVSTLADDFSRYSSEEYGYFYLSDAFNKTCKSSPVKVNPTALELLRARAARANGALAAVFTALKGAPGNAADMTECLPPLFAAEDAVKESVGILLPLLYEIAFDEARMQKGVADGFTTAGDLTTYLTEKGMLPADAYRMTADIIACCRENNKRLDTLPYETYAAFSNLFETDINQLMRPKNAVRFRRHEGDPGEGAVKNEIRHLKHRLLRLLPDPKG